MSYMLPEQRRGNRNSCSLTSGKLPGEGNQTVADHTEGSAVPSYKTKVSKGNRHVAKHDPPDYKGGLLWSLSVNNHPMHFGTAITGHVPTAREEYFHRYLADHEDANGLLPHQYTGLTAVERPMDPFDIVAGLEDVA